MIMMVQYETAKIGQGAMKLRLDRYIALQAAFERRRHG